MFATIAGRYPSVPGTPHEALTAVLTDQLELGLGMVGDGEIRALTTDTDVEEAVRAWERAHLRIAELAGEAGAAAPPVKACLVGPMSTAGSVDAAVDRVRAAIVALVAAGAPVVQVDEPRLGGPEALADADRRRAVRAWRRCLDGVEGHVSLALPGGGASAVGAEAMAGAPFASYLVDLITGPDDWRPVARLPGERGVILGVLDPRRTGVEGPEVLVWAARYAASMRGRGLERVGLAPSAGLERLTRAAARERLATLAEAARVAALPPDELARTLDPRAIDARSAALGRWEPRPRRAQNR